MRRYLGTLLLLLLCIVGMPLLMGQIGGGIVSGPPNQSLNSVTLTGLGNCLVADTTSLVVDCTNHRVGIGTSSPAQPLEIVTGTTDPSATTNGSKTTNTLTLTANNAQTGRGVQGEAKVNQAGFNLTTSQGIRGMEGIGTASGASGTVTEVIGVRGNVQNTGAGILTAGSSFLASAGNTGGGTFTTWSGFNVPNTTPASTQYGFRGQFASNANRWNLYMDGTAQNYLGGNLGIGSGKSAPGVSVDSAGTINAATGYQVAGLPLYRTCGLVIGAENGSALADADLGPQGRQCFISNASTLVEIVVAADGGTPNVIPRRNRAGSTSNFVSSALATAAAGGLACSKTAAVAGLDGATTCAATLQNTGLNAGDWIELGSGTAGGTAKRMSISLIYTTP
jgi:hypothetical protein